MKQTAGEAKAMELTESSREDWQSQSFFKSIFMGKFKFNMIDPFPVQKGLDGHEYLDFLEKFKNFLEHEVDSDRIDREGEIPKETFARIKELRLGALKIDKKYGGHGFTQAEYNQILTLCGSKDANLGALLSAHQSIGVPQPLILFGTDAQKEKYLTRIAQGQISAFALTENNVGSDPAKMEASVKDEGDYYVLNGEKLWTTNGTIAEVVVVMARHEDDEKISAFIVEMDWEGCKVEKRCHFMGLRALYNGVLSFTNVKIPKENLIGERGKGLKIALVTLNTGRLALPAAIVGSTKKMLEICREWCVQREQWGKPIYEHEAIAQKLSDLTVSCFAQEAVANLATALYDRNEDVRLEAAVAKLFCSEYAWADIDTTVQIRGGRGYETADSLKARGEEAIPVERMMRDSRINRIFEGSTEIMKLFIAREAVDEHLKVSGILLDNKKTIKDKVLALPRIALFYATWYPALWIPSIGLKWKARKLARSVFHGMVFHGPSLQNRQMFLFRCVDIAVEIYAQAACEAYAKTIPGSEALADLFCENSNRKIKHLFGELWFNSDKKKNIVAGAVAKFNYGWLEKGIIARSSSNSYPDLVHTLTPDHRTQSSSDRVH